MGANKGPHACTSLYDTLINTGNPSSVYNDADGTRNDMGAFGGPESNWK